MDKQFSRTLGAFVVFFSVALPLFAALAAAAAYRPLVGLLGARGGVSHPLAEFFFNRFPWAVSLPVAVGVFAGLAAWRRLKRIETDPASTLGGLFLIQGGSAMLALVWLALYALAAGLA